MGDTEVAAARLARPPGGGKVAGPVDRRVRFVDHNQMASQNGAASSAGAEMAAEAEMAAATETAGGADAHLTVAAVTGSAPATDAGDASEIDRRIADLRALLEQGLSEGVGVGHSLGIHLGTLEVGRTVWTLQPSPATANAMFTVHGGVLATLMDTAMGSAVYTALPPETYYTTLELKVNFVRSVSLTADLLTCEARTIHVGRRTATAEGTVTGTDGKLIAHGTCTCLLTPASSA